MKKLLSLIISILLFFNTAYSAQTRTVEKSNADEAWKVDGKFIKAECFDYIWVSGDRYEQFYDEYFEKPKGSHWDDPKFVKFTENVGMYLNKEVPLNHSIDPGWSGYSEISLTKQLEGCLSEKPETFVRFTDGTSNTIGYKVVHNFDPYYAKELAPYIYQKFESLKQVEIEEWGGGSMPPQTHMVVFGVLELEGKKVLLPLRNKSILTEITKRDTFFRGNGRFSYEAEFDLNDDITKIININDFKQMVSSDGCFKINDFATDGKIYNFLNKNKLETYCNEVRPFDDINWLLKQSEFEDSQDLIFDDKEYRFSNLIRSQVPDIQVPWADYPIRLGEELIESIWFNGDIQYLKNRQQVVVSGCVYKFCSQKGFIFAYKDNFIGLIQHGTEEFDKEDFLVFSKKHKNLSDLPDDFFTAVKAWIKKTNSDYGFVVIEPMTVRFLGSDNKIKKAENLFVKKNIEEVEVVQGYEGILEKQVKDKANALTKNYNAELFNLINKKDTARNILKHREFEYALSKEINEKWIDFSRKGKDQWSFLNEKFYHLLNSSSKKANEIDINNDDFFIVTGCVDISCDEGALLYVDKKNKVVIGSIVHKYLGKDNLTEINAAVIFSKKIDLFKELPKNFWHKHITFQMAIYNLTKRKGDMMFIGSDNKDMSLSQVDVLGFDGI